MELPPIRYAGRADSYGDWFASSGEIVLVGSGTHFRGQKGAKEFANMWADGFPEGKVKIDKLIAADTSVVVQYTNRINAPRHPPQAQR